jgi:hypothetical protein
MGTSDHWNWTAAAPLTSDVSQIGLATVQDARGNAGPLSLFYIASNDQMLNAQQRIAGDSTSWEVQPALSAAPPQVKHVAVKAKQFAVAGAIAGVVDLLVVSTKNQVTRFRQAAPGNGWQVTDPQPFAGDKVQQVAATVDASGQLQLVALTTSGDLIRQRQMSAGNLNWNAPQKIAGISAKQVAIAANSNNGNLLEIFFIDHHNVLSHLRQQNVADDVNGWGLGSPLLQNNPTAKEFAIGQNADGRLELFVVDTNTHLFHIWQTSTADTTQWSDKTRFAGYSANQVTVARNQDGRLEIFYVGTDDSLYHNWQVVPNGDWIGETNVPGYSGKQIAVAQNAGDGHLEVIWIDKNNVVQHSWQVVPNAGWVNTNGTGGSVGTSSSLGGATNLLLITGNCGLLTDVAVTISITQDIVFSSDGKPSSGSSVKGFSWQLNCIGRAADYAVAQQYVIGYSGGHIYGMVNNWTVDPADVTLGGFDPLINSQPSLVSLSGHKIPAGYQLVIRLTNDEVGNITAGTFLVIDDKGNNVGKKTVDLKSSIVGPIVDMQLDLVGPGNSESVILTSGAGSIEYAASSILTATETAPPCTGFAASIGTQETSNSTYGPMSAGSSNVLQQTFSVNVGGAPRRLQIRALRPPTPLFHPSGKR